MNIFINSKEDFIFVKKRYNNAQIFVENYSLYFELRNEKVFFFYDYLENENLSEFNENLNNFYLNWYRDDKYQDYTSTNNLSLAQVLHKRISLLFSYDFKMYVCIKNISKNGKKFYFIKNSSKSLERLKKTFPHKILYLNTFNENKFIKKNNYNTPERAFFFNPKQRLLFLFIRLIQFCFKFLIVNKTLYEVDWSSEKYFKNNSKNILFKSKKNIFKSYYHTLNNNLVIKYQSKIPLKFEFNLFNYEFLSKKIDFEQNGFDNKLISHFIDLIKSEYEEARLKLINNYAFYEDIMLFYKPKNLIISGQSSFTNIVAIQVSKINNVQIDICLDGYQTHIYKSEWMRDKNNKSFLFDNYYTFGKASYELNNKKLKIPKKSIKLITAPTFLNLNTSKNSLNNIIYDAIILAYSPALDSVVSYWDNQLETETEIIKSLFDCGFTRIAIKFKNGANIYTTQNLRDYNSYKNFYLMKYNKQLPFKNENIDFINNKELYEIIEKTNLIVGGVSTAIIESFYLDKEYYIYEPLRNGITNYNIDNSNILNYDNVIRDPEILKKNIKANKSFSIPKDYLF